MSQRILSPRAAAARATDGAMMQTTVGEPAHEPPIAEASRGEPMAAHPQTTATRLHPKEHGAYAILAIPIVSALIASEPTLVGFCVVIAAVAGFLAHEPLLIAWGHRGRRAQQSTPIAKSRLIVLLLIAAVAGTTAMAMGSPSVRWSLVACLAIASSGFAVAVAGSHRTLGGQLWGVVGLSIPSVPILIAGGISVGGAMMVWVAWLLGFSSTTVAVRSVIAAQKRQPRWRHATILGLISLFIGSGILFETYWPLVTLPMIALSWFLLIAPPPAKHLKRVGWTLVFGTIATALLVILHCPV